MRVVSCRVVRVVRTDLSQWRDVLNMMGEICTCVVCDALFYLQGHLFSISFDITIVIR